MENRKNKIVIRTCTVEGWTQDEDVVRLKSNCILRTFFTYVFVWKNDEHWVKCFRSDSNHSNLCRFTIFERIQHKKGIMMINIYCMAFAERVRRVRYLFPVKPVNIFYWTFLFISHASVFSAIQRELALCHYTECILDWKLVNKSLFISIYSLLYTEPCKYVTITNILL